MPVASSVYLVIAVKAQASRRRRPREGARPVYSGKRFDELLQFGLVDVGHFGFIWELTGCHVGPKCGERVDPQISGVNRKATLASGPDPNEVVVNLVR